MRKKESVDDIQTVGRSFTLDAREDLPSGGYRTVTLHIRAKESDENHLLLTLTGLDTSGEGYEEAIPHSDTQESYGDEKSSLK